MTEWQIIDVSFNFPQTKQQEFKFRFDFINPDSIDYIKNNKKISKSEAVKKVDEAVHAFLMSICDNEGKIIEDSITRCFHGFPYNRIECLYSPSHWTLGHRNPNEVIAQYERKMLLYAEDLRKHHIDCQLNIVYDPDLGSRCKCKCLDIYGANVLPRNSPIFAFVHGGYWMCGSKEVAKSMVRSLVSSGIVVAVVGYNLVPVVNIDQMVEEISCAIQYLNSLAIERQSSGLYVGGHSAGAHLAFMSIANNDVPTLASLKGLFLVAGLYDLTPLLKTTCFKQMLNLNEKMTERNSPIRFIDQLGSKYPRLKIDIVLGSHDSPAFQEQSLTFYQVLKNRFSPDINQKNASNTTKNYNNGDTVGHWKISLDILENEDHFSLVENFHDMNSVPFQCLYKFISECYM